MVVRDRSGSVSIGYPDKEALSVSSFFLDYLSSLTDLDTFISKNYVLHFD